MSIVSHTKVLRTLIWSTFDDENSKKYKCDVWHSKNWGRSRLCCRGLGGCLKDFYEHGCSKLSRVESPKSRHLRILPALKLFDLFSRQSQSCNTSLQLSKAPTKLWDRRTKYSLPRCELCFEAVDWPSTNDQLKIILLWLFERVPTFSRCRETFFYQAVVNDDVIRVTSLAVYRNNSPNFVP